MYPYIYLASQSSRRQKLLKQIGVSFKRLQQNTDEHPLSNEKPYDFVTRLANEKALNSFSLLQQKQLTLAPVLGADTIVVVNQDDNNMIIGKPENKQHAQKILNLLSNKTHHVITAICLTDGHKTLSAVSSSEVSFKKLSPREISNYWDTGEAVDKAGAYAVQGKAARFIKNISGSYSGIMGLPLYETSNLLTLFDVSF
jgi:septum formation protein